MKITIITINYNNINGLKTTVNSVLNQEYQDLIEYIIVDGNSADGTKCYLESLPKRVKWISEKDRGISDAFNKGLNIASGDTILCLNSGDYFVNNHVIKKVVEDWSRLNVDILSYKVHVTDNVYIPATDDRNLIYESCTEPHQGTFVSKALYEKVGGYSEEYKIRMDYHFFARCRKIKATFYYINDHIVNYEPGGTSMKPENKRKFWLEGMSVKLMYNIKSSFKDIVKLCIYNLFSKQ